MRAHRFGVAFRLGAGVAAITACTIVASVAAVVLLGQFRDGFAGIASAKLPAVTIIGQLSQQTERVVTDAAAIASGDEATRQKGLQSIAGQRLVLQAMADQLQEDRGNLPILDGFNEHLTAMIDNARRLSKTVDAKSKVDAAMAGHRQRLLDLPDFEPGTRADEPSMRFALASERANHTLALALAGESPEEIAHLRSEFAEQMTQATGLAVQVPVAVRSQAEAIVTALAAIGTGPADVFTLRGQQLALFRTEVEVLSESRRLSSLFSDSVAGSIQTDSVALTSVVERGMTFLQMLAAACVVGSLGIFLYINRAIIRRLVGLKDCMYAHVEGRPAAIPVAGSDEISAMGKGLQFFVTTIEGREQALRAAKEVAEAKSEQVASLLDNSGEGFLSFGRDLVIHPEYSRACEAMFGASPAGRDVAELLCGGNDNAAALFRTIVPQVLGKCDPWKREVMLSLLPHELQCGDTLIDARYTVLDDNRMMAVLRDITEERKLEQKIESEHRQLEMIVAAVTERGDFFDTVDAFRAFVDEDLPGILAASITPRLMVKEIYRQVHTFKGLFNQFSFQQTPQALHALETRLSTLLGRGEMLAVKDIADAVAGHSFNDLIDADLGVIRNALGQAFLENSGQIALSPAQAKQLEEMAGCLMRGEPVDAWSAEMRALLNELVRLRKVPVKEMLEGFNRLVRQTAEKLEKEVAPVVVEGGHDLWIDPEAYRPFLRSLVHVFRNAVIHGIEDPDTRLSSGKVETGTIRCSVTVDDDAIKVEIADDGAGIDVAALRQKAVDAGLLDAKLAPKLSDEEVIDLVFADTITTENGVTEYSGRGIGLSAVRSAARSMGGDARVRTAPGKGTHFQFSLPVRQDAVALYVPSPGGTSGPLAAASMAAG